MSLLISVNRSQLDLPPLLIAGSRSAGTAEGMPGLWIPAGGYARPQFAARRTFAPDSAFAPGKQVLGAVLDEGRWPLTIRVVASSAAVLAALRDVVELAFSQRRYPVTVTLDGVSETWRCDYAWPTWPDAAAAWRMSAEDRCVLTIPVRVP